MEGRGREGGDKNAKPLWKYSKNLTVKQKKTITLLVRFPRGVLKSQIQPERSTHSPTEVKKTLNYMLRESMNGDELQSDCIPRLRVRSVKVPGRSCGVQAKGQAKGQPRARPKASQGQAKGHPCSMDLVLA